jgi:hypothetical protein
VTLFDLEPVCALARERFSRTPARDRLHAVSGDFHRDPLPAGADCALVCNVLHDWSEEECVALLRRTHRALEPGGQIVVVDFMPAHAGESLEASLMSLALLLDTCRGRVYRRDEVQAWLEACGFTRVRHAPLTGGMDVVAGAKDS